MHIESLTIAQVDEAELHIELVEKLREESDYIEVYPMDESRSEFFIRTHSLLDIIKYFEDSYPMETQAKELYNKAYKFDYIMIIN